MDFKTKHLFVIASLFCQLTTASFAIESGDYTYELNAADTNTVTITGYSGTNSTVVIPDTLDSKPVTVIGTYLFSYNANLESVTIPDSVETIEESAFRFCTDLTNVMTGNGLTDIGKAAFRTCMNLQDLTMGNQITNIGPQAFYDCDSLPTIAIPDSVLYIGDEAFFSCDSLSDIIIPDNVLSIGANAFYYCYNVTNISIGSSVTDIGAAAFSDCTRLTNVAIPDSVESLEYNAFYYCASLTNITIGTGLTNIVDTAGLRVCPNLASITVNTNNAAFSSIEGVLFNKDQTTLILYPCADDRTAYTISEGVITIGSTAFRWCQNLTRIKIPDSVVNIESEAFMDCESLSSITIPDGITNIGNDAFCSCASLTAVYFAGDTPPDATSLFSSSYPTIYYRTETSGWDSTYAGRPTLLWNPQIQTGDETFGVQINGFGFNITELTNALVVVRACTNLEEDIWEPVFTNSMVDGTASFCDSDWSNRPACYYRLDMP